MRQPRGNGQEEDSTQREEKREREASAVAAQDFFGPHAMFDPPLPGSLICGTPLSFVPDSETKYASFLEWWFAVGCKAPELTAQGWGGISGRNVTQGKSEVIPAEDWAKLSEEDRLAIKAWSGMIRTTCWFD